MSRFQAVEDRAEKYLRKNNFSKNVFFGLIVLLSTSITAVGFAFAGYVFVMIKELREASEMLARFVPNGISQSPIVTPEKLAASVGENTIWVPMVAGVVIILMAVIYYFEFMCKES